MDYATVVLDPPWEQRRGSSFDGRGNAEVKAGLPRRTNSPTKPLSYQTMTLPQIASLPVRQLAAPDAHLYLWVTNKYIEAAYALVRGWGFDPKTLLTWVKAPMGMGLGGAFVQTSEHVLFARRGKDVSLARSDTTWWQWQRRRPHSTKPPEFLDVVERISPSPRLEMFARTARPDWDYWGDEQHGTLSTVVLPG